MNDLDAGRCQHGGQEESVLIYVLSWALENEVNESYILVMDEKINEQHILS